MRRVVCMLAAVALAGCGVTGAVADRVVPPRAPATPSITATVTKIVDGDTIEAVYVDPDRPDRKASENLRLIGFDTPETKNPRTPVECYGAEASARLAALVPPGSRVTLAADTDRFADDGRPLFYVDTAEGVDVGRQMIAEGFARWVYVEPNGARLATYKEAEVEARFALRVGLWAACPDATAWAEGKWGRDG